MQGERSYLDSFPETMNPNPESDPMERSSARDNVLDPVDGNNNLQDPLNVHDGSRGGWYRGESSSSANSGNQLFGGELKVENGWSSSSSSSNTCMVTDTTSVDWRYEPPSNSGESGDPYMHRPLNMNNPNTYNPVNANAIHGYTNASLETQHFPSEYSGQNGNEFSSSIWGSSCKRKAFEGCSRQSSSLGYLSTSPKDEDMGRLNPSSSSGLPNSRNTVVIGREASERFPSANMAEVLERSQYNYGVETFNGQQEPILHDLSVLHGAHHPSTEVSELGPRFSGPFPLNHPPNQNNLVQVSGSRRNTVPYPQGEFYGSRGVSSSDPSQYEIAARGFSETRDRSIFGSYTEARQILFESPNWSFTPTNSSSYRDIASSSHTDPSSSSRSFSPAWITHQNPVMHTQQRYSEQSPWSRFPPGEPAPRGERGHFSPFIPGPSSPVDDVMPSGSTTEVHPNRSNSRSFWRDVSMDDINGWRALAGGGGGGGGGRDRLVSEIRSVLNAMRRAESYGSENYEMFDPYITGIADLHDRHRDMRLDVDNMSYEELLALEERIGDVKTGLSEDEVMQLMKHSLYIFVTKESSSNPEPCSVCQENYIVGDDIGELDCGHEFHTNCIKQWLMLKNICPICKTTGLAL